MSDELNRKLKQMPEGFDYAVQVIEETPTQGDVWKFLSFPNAQLSYIITDKMANEILQALSDRPARIVKICRYVPWGGQEIIVHGVTRCNAKALRRD